MEPSSPLPVSSSTPPLSSPQAMPPVIPSEESSSEDHPVDEGLSEAAWRRWHASREKTFDLFGMDTSSSESKNEEQQRLSDRYRRLRMEKDHLKTLPSHLPQDAELPAYHNTYSHTQQIEHRAGYLMRGVVGLVNRVEEADCSHSPNRGSSALQESWSLIAINLLCSIDEDRLLSFTENLIIPDAVRRQWTFPESNEDIPAIYSNLVSPASGIPLTVAEFKLLIEALAVLSGSMPSTRKVKTANSFKRRDRNLRVRFVHA